MVRVVLYKQVVLILYLAASLLRVVVTVVIKLLEQQVAEALVAAVEFKLIGLPVQAHQDKGMTAVLALLLMPLMLAAVAVAVNLRLAVLELTQLEPEEMAALVEHHQYLDHQLNMLAVGAVVVKT